MKSTTFSRIAALSLFALGGFAQPLLAEGPNDLEALAEKAKEAAGDEPAEVKKAPKTPKSATKTGAKKPVTPAAAKAPVKAAAKEVVVDLEKRAKKLGLMATISPDVSAVMTLNNGARLWEELTESELGQVLLETMAANEVDLTDPESPGAQLAALFQEEFLVASGKGTAKQLENAVSLSGLSNKYQIATMVQLWTIGLEGGDAFMDSNPFSSIMQVMQDDPDFLVNLVSALKMPPVLLAARVSDDDQRDEFAAGLEIGAGMALEMGAEEMPFLKGLQKEVSGITFSGMSIDGRVLVESLEESQGLSEMLGTMLDPATAQDLVNSLKEKNLVLLGGVSEEAIYLYLGDSVDEIPLVDDAKQGITASEQFTFIDPYLDEDLVNVFWVKEELVEVGASSETVFGDYVEGIRLGMKGNDALGDTKKLEGMFTKLLKLEEDFFGLGQSQAAAGVSFLRGDGLYSESFGGYDDGLYNWDTPHQLGSVAGDAFLSVQSVANAETSKVALEYVETAFATAYEMALLMEGPDEAPEKAEQFLEGFTLFDKKMKGDALALWKGMRTSEAGLGMESIMEVDLAGSWPTVPGVPEPVIEKGLAPRISYLSPVTDRAKLAESWEQVEGAATGILKTVSEMMDEDIPMQKPMSSQNDGLKTWFFPIPMQTDDFVPSVTIDDELMIMSTSKERAIALAEMAKKEGSAEKGMVMVMNFAPLQAFLSNWYTLIAEDPAAVLKDEDTLKNFQESQEIFESMIRGVGELHSLRIHIRMENGQLRSSSHFKTK